MAITKIVAFDANDNKVDVFTTDDPAEGGGSTLQDIVDALKAGQAPKSDSLPVTLPSDRDTVPTAPQDFSQVTGQSPKSDSLPVTLASDEDAVGVEDSSGTDIDPAKNVDGKARAAKVTDTSHASIQVPNGRTTITVMVKASGGAVDVTVEVSASGNDWYEETDVFAANVADGDAEAETFQTGAEYVRAAGDANVGAVEIAAKGA